MSDLFNLLKYTMTPESSLKSPHFYKASKNTEKQLEQLYNIYKIASDKQKPLIEKDIRMLKYGIAGEKNVIFELENSHLPIIILHDLYIEYEGLSAQIDFIVITRKFNLVIECKNLFGNIEINNNGDFIRTIRFGNRYIKEGIYSPITQNTRHIELVKKVRLLSKDNLFTKVLFEKYFNENYKTVVVLANPKTVIKMRYAKKEIKNQIIRCDQLVNYIKKLLKDSKNDPLSDKGMYKQADIFLCLHKEKEIIYSNKGFVIDKENLVVKENIKKIEDTDLYKELKEYRYVTSKAEGIKPYYIFNNLQLEALIAAMPKSIGDIKEVSGFGDVKCKKYGEDILKIINKHD